MVEEASKDKSLIKDGLRRLKRTIGNVIRIEVLLLFFSIALALVQFGESIYMNFISPFLSEIGISNAEIGVFFTVFYAANTLLSIPAGYISDRIGRNIIVVSLFALAAVVFSYTVAQTRAELLVVRAVHGAASGFIFPIARAYVMDKTTEENRGQTMGTFILFVTLAGMIAPTVGGFLRDFTGSFDPLFYIAAVFPAVTAIFLIIVVRDLGKGFTVQKMKLPTRELVHNRSFTVVLLMFAMLYFAGGILTPVMPLFATQILKMSYTALGFLSLPMGILFASSQFVAGSLSDRYGRKSLLIYPLFIYVIGVTIAGLSVNSLMFFGAYMLVGIGAAPYATVAYSIIGDVVAQERRGIASGAVTTLGGTGMMLGPLLGSAIGGIFGLRLPFFLCAAMVLATIAMLYVMLPADSREVAE